MNPVQSHDRCPNCLTPLRGPYCSECGQHQRDLDRPFREVVAEGLSTFVAFDTRIGKTLGPLITMLKLVVLSIGYALALIVTMIATLVVTVAFV